MFFFSIGTLMFPETANTWLHGTKNAAIASFDWLFALTPLLTFLFCVGLAASPMGHIRIGGAEATKEFSDVSWMAMLFAAGIGVGYLFYGAAEPLTFYLGNGGTPFAVPPASPQSHDLAVATTVFHWGLSPWAIYGVIGLSLAYFAHNKRLPLSIRSIFYPLLGDRVWGWPGHVIDLTAVVSAIFGLATSIGLGATQATSGIAYLTGVEPTIALSSFYIAIVTLLASLSVVRGLDGGIKVLSNVNMVLAILLLFFVVVAGPTVLIAGAVFENLFHYATNAPALSLWFGRGDTQWYQDWSIFYWAWWVAWAPFVGMFIARISKGRTVREYLIGVLIIPTAIGLLWFSTFGETAIYQVQNGIGGLGDEVGGVSLILFQLLDALPLFGLTSAITLLLLIIFIVTSADSGALVIGHMTADHHVLPSVGQRIVWAVLFGVVSIALLYGGGTDALSSLQAGTIATAVPFTFMVLASCVSLFLAMREEA